MHSLSLCYSERRDHSSPAVILISQTSFNLDLSDQRLSDPKQNIFVFKLLKAQFSLTGLFVEAC